MNALEHAHCINTSVVSPLAVFQTFLWFNTFDRGVLCGTRAKEYTEQFIILIFHAANHKTNAVYSERVSRLHGGKVCATFVHVKWNGVILDKREWELEWLHFSQPEHYEQPRELQLFSVLNFWITKFQTNWRKLDFYVLVKNSYVWILMI